ncbi:hypothetical protein [Methylomagnum ishizawai]|uniref:hypothetical protein n=1 Tax=Methylomagnum ishizawai TaxID=1760988 RepID=UPI001C32F7F7|nr:hypothetical protein [Methylomagnum ishizawai]BBL75581.1 hypothetical protein MishRS11D_26790 [Methylomagnum ishizawai]
MDPKSFARFGFPALLVAVLLFLHHDERKEWRETIDNMFNRMDQRQAETNNLLKDNTIAIQTLADRQNDVNNRRLFQSEYNHNSR